MSQRVDTPKVGSVHAPRVLTAEDLRRRDAQLLKSFLRGPQPQQTLSMSARRDVARVEVEDLPPLEEIEKQGRKPLQF
jgi:hypothetical protein